MRYKDLDGEFLKEIKTVLKQNKFMRLYDKKDKRGDKSRGLSLIL